MPTTDSMSAGPDAFASDAPDLWLTTGDHKRLGRVWLVVAVLALILGGATGGLLSAERASTGFDVLDADNFTQVFSVHGVSSVFLFLIPAWLGLALVMVPLQVGARNVALPRASAFATWLFVLGGGLVEVAYLADGGPGGADADANELWLLGMACVVVALVTVSVALVTTVVVARAPGLVLADVGAFSWSILIAATLWLVTLPAVVAGLVLAWLGAHFGGAAGGMGAEPLAETINWFLGPPQVYLLAIPAIGVAGEAVAIFTSSRRRPFPVLVVGMGALAGFGFGAFANPVVGADFGSGGLQAWGVAAVAPALVVVAGLLEIARGKDGPLRITTPLLTAGASAATLILGVAAGATMAVEEADLIGTTWGGAQLHYIGLGAATLGLIGGVHLWASKVLGRTLNDVLGKISVTLLFVGTNLLVIPDLFTGTDGMPFGEPFFGSVTDDLSTWEVLSQTAGVGGAIALAGLLVAVAALVASAPSGDEIPSDPWSAEGLEWSVPSPPPAENFESLPDLARQGPS